MGETILKKIYEDVEFLKSKVLDIEKTIKSMGELEFMPLTKDELEFFNKAYNESKETGFWASEKELRKNGINI